MLRTDEILSTIEMLHAEHLDVRAVTLALNLNDCAAPSVDHLCRKLHGKITSRASRLVEICDRVGAKYGIPVVCIVYNNDSWGTWPSAARSARSTHLHLFQENIRYEKIAEAFGARGEFVTTPEQLRDAIARGYKFAANEKVSTLINCKALKEFSSAGDYPPGANFNPEPGVGAVAH